ncbi:hypothetical protein PR048_027779 [Dryococelus australis]|uniref:Uncharacterized protein n=1 Tax=Dryococelus australis TaxID=614101 RepID=A0ABQ9GHE5_9NEOP|nr:hypothetical protein PR048_027779 [Dryococelus australis]
MGAPRRFLVSGRNTSRFIRLHSGYWLLLRAPSVYSTEQAPAQPCNISPHATAIYQTTNRHIKRNISVATAQCKQTRYFSEWRPNLDVHLTRPQRVASFGPQGHGFKSRLSRRMRGLLEVYTGLVIIKLTARCVENRWRAAKPVQARSARAHSHFTGATVAERLARSPPTKANRAQSPASSPDFRKWESFRMVPLVGGYSRGSPVSPAPSFRRSSIFTSITLIGSKDFAVRSRPNLFTPSHLTIPEFVLGHLEHVSFQYASDDQLLSTPALVFHYSEASRRVLGGCDGSGVPLGRPGLVQYWLGSRLVALLEIHELYAPSWPSATWSCAFSLYNRAALSFRRGVMEPCPHSSRVGWPTCSRRVAGSRPGASDVADAQLDCGTGNSSTSRSH